VRPFLISEEKKPQNKKYSCYLECIRINLSEKVNLKKRSVGKIIKNIIPVLMVPHTSTKFPVLSNKIMHNVSI